jgi:hypothetical protein
MTTDINQAFPAEIDGAAKALYEQQQKALNRFTTRYVYLPFQDGQCTAIPGGYVPAGRIHPIPAPEGKTNVRLLPEGAQVLRVVKTGGDEPESIAIYPMEVEPIVNGVLALYLKEGAVEIAPLFGMSVRAFEQHRINDLIFGEEIPSTARGLRDRMTEVKVQAAKQTNQASATLSKIADIILRGVDQCAAFCSEHVRERHLQMENPHDQNPKRYSRRDLRALEFIEAVRKEQYLQQVAEQQQQAAMAIPEMLKIMQEREAATLEALTAGFAQLAQALTGKEKSGKSS